MEPPRGPGKLLFFNRKKKESHPAAPPLFAYWNLQKRSLLKTLKFYLIHIPEFTEWFSQMLGTYFSFSFAPDARGHACAYMFIHFMFLAVPKLGSPDQRRRHCQPQQLFPNCFKKQSINLYSNAATVFSKYLLNEPIILKLLELCHAENWEAGAEFRGALDVTYCWLHDVLYPIWFKPTDIQRV